MSAASSLLRADAERRVAAAVDAGGLERAEALLLAAGLGDAGIRDAVREGALESKR
ncbi:MAG: hypothetical protein JRF70_05135, partial [Deltaproteobacteria bacterium]|nr:hypothetical protein [Deltaproteobacteria bacterium]